MNGDETWTTPAEQAAWRLDKAVAARPSVGARRKARDVVESGKASVNGQPCADVGRTLAEGDVVTIAWNRPGTGRAHRLARVAVTSVGVSILFEDAWLVAVDKPAGLLTDAATRSQERDRDTVTDRLRRYLRPQGKTPFAAHRIDRDTSGVVLFAKDEATFAALRGQFYARTPERVYLAVVDGRPTPRAGLWSDWMAWDEERLLQLPAGSETPGAVLAQAHYRVTSDLSGGRSVVEVRLVTGRRNQIRVHAMLRGHPLVGERQYLPQGAAGRSAGLARNALHAHRLTFDHPATGARITVESPVPPDLSALM
jgi:23S rRNA pseudouridine1911/1915/1917 synthase